MRWVLRTGVFLLAGLLMPEHLGAQISPGALSAAHAHLEGVQNCTQCHAIGRGIDNTGCLTCHDDIAARMRRREGLHGSYASRQCVECHKEHHGREFALVRFDTSRIDHQRFGFDLKGKHRALMCSRCHTPSLVKDQAIRRNAKRMQTGTYLGLGQECVDCHQDVHRGQFRQACAGCHSPEGWNPAVGFDHGQTAFPLIGQHLRVACAQCHKPTGPANTIQFTRLSFGSCASCHHDPHRGRFAQSCESCHTASGWASGAASRFNHATTRFPLKGKHAALACAKCHDGPSATGRRSFHPANFQRCSDCHQNVHTLGQQRSSTQCEQCHVESGWKEGPARTFNHAQTGFALKGRHSALACNECHGPGGPKTVPGKSLRREGILACADCHADVHRGQITNEAKAGSCERCHREQGFLPSTFSQAEHERSRFPLTGAHRAVPCNGCHKEILAGGAKVRQFRWEHSIDCTRCHDDIHRGTFNASADQGCTGCHTTAAWDNVRYAHDQTSFALTGSHARLECWKCHGAKAKRTPVITWTFRGTPTQCVACHGDRPLQR